MGTYTLLWIHSWFMVEEHRLTIKEVLFSNFKLELSKVFFLIEPLKEIRENAKKC